MLGSSVTNAYFKKGERMDQESMLLKWDENFMSLCFQVVILIRFVIYMCVNYIY